MLRGDGQQQQYKARQCIQHRWWWVLQIIQPMLLATQDRLQIQAPLSRVYNQIKQCLPMQKTSKFWFGPMLSLCDQFDSVAIRQDITKLQYIELLKLLNILVVDLLSFYIKTPPQQCYRLLHLTRTIFGHITSAFTPQHSTHSTLMHRVHLNNTLGIFLLKHRQYNAAIECFETVVEVVKQEKIDVYADIFLVAISNYLSFVKLNQYQAVKTKITELLGFLKQLYQGLIEKYTGIGCKESSLQIMLSVYRQHSIYLGMSFQAQNRLLIKKYEQSSNNTKDKVSTISEDLKSSYYLLKSRPAKTIQLQIKKKQLSFFSSSLFSTLLPSSFKTRNQQELRSTQLSRYQDINKVDSTLDSSELVINREHGRPASRRNIKKNAVSNQTIQIGEMQHAPAKIRYESAQPKKQSIDLGSLKKIETKTQKMEKRIKIINKNEPVLLKVNYSIIEVINDGVILSDFLRQRKKFLTWSQVFLIIKNLRFSCIFAHYLPICTFYDIGSILSLYVQKASINHEHNGAVVTEYPKQLLEINMYTKLYEGQGKFLRLFIMNQYDTSHKQLSIDFYLAQYEQFFKQVTENQYISKINKKIFKQCTEYEKRDNEVCNVEHWKKKKETAALQLSSQIKIQAVCELPYIKSNSFKILLFMPNLSQVVLQLREKDIKQQPNSEHLTLTILPLSLSSQHHSSPMDEQKLKIPIYKICRYFSLPLLSNPSPYEQITAWFKKHGRFIIEGYLGCFQDYPYSYNNLQFFQVITYAKKIEIMETGKYWTPVIAQLIGSKDRIWGICIRYFEQAFVRDNVTFIYCPYYGLLSPTIKLSAEQRKDLLIKLLYKNKVAETYRKLQQHKLTGSMVNIMQYWHLVDF